MSEVADLLELLHGARNRYRTVRGLVRHRSNLRRSQRAHERWAEEAREAGHGFGSVYAVAVDEVQPRAQRDQHERLIRFWSEPPDRLREETETLLPQPHEHLTVRDGRRWWTYSPEWGAVSNVAAGKEGERMGVGGGELWTTLLDPSGMIPLLDFAVEGEAELLHRRALRVRATPRGRGDAFLFRTPLPVGADAYELVVGRKRGTVLRAAALLCGEAFCVSEFEELVFDEDLPPETFVFEPPPGEAIRPPDFPMHEHLTIEEAARRTSFPVFYFPELPPGRWALDVIYAPPRQRPSIHESLHLAYHRVDATHHVTVTERPATTKERHQAQYRPSGVEVEHVERGGTTFTVQSPQRRDGRPLTVSFAREGTAIELSSNDLNEDVLLELAASMERFEAE